MNTKWYISALFLIFAYLGLSQEQVYIPNQEITLEFIDTKVEQKDIKNTIADVRKKLLDVGVSNIKIQEIKSGTLKISYYSVAPIDNIKEALLKENQFVVNQGSKKESEKKENNEPTLDYKVDIYELIDTTDTSSHKNQLVFESKFNLDRFTLNDSQFFTKDLKTHKSNQLYKTAYKVYRNNPFTKDYSSYKEPEVRAGPSI